MAWDFGDLDLDEAIEEQTRGLGRAVPHGLHPRPCPPTCLGGLFACGRCRGPDCDPDQDHDARRNGDLD